jgi:hypothetical protein
MIVSGPPRVSRRRLSNTAPPIVFELAAFVNMQHSPRRPMGDPLREAGPEHRCPARGVQMLLATNRLRHERR